MQHRRIDAQDGGGEDLVKLLILLAAVLGILAFILIDADTLGLARAPDEGTAEAAPAQQDAAPQAQNAVMAFLIGLLDRPESSAARQRPAGVLHAERQWQAVASASGAGGEIYGIAFIMPEPGAWDSADAYTFTFDGRGFVQPGAQIRAFLDILGAAYPRKAPASSNIAPQSCLSRGAKSRALSADIVLLHAVTCRLRSSTNAQRSVIVGVVWPESPSLPLADGQALCQGEVAGWFGMDRFQGTDLAICLLVDGLADASPGGHGWSDVIPYQRYSARRFVPLEAQERNLR